jgi:hypothetical protein
MLHVTGAEYIGGYRVRLQFSDGFCGIADLDGKLTGPVFQPLNHLEAFREFELAGHTLCWPNGADFAPEYLREIAKETPAEQRDAPERRLGAELNG